MTATRGEIETALLRARVLAAKAGRAAHRRLAAANACGRPGRVLRRVKVLVEVAVRFTATARALGAMLDGGIAPAALVSEDYGGGGLYAANHYDDERGKAALADLCHVDEADWIEEQR